MEYNFFCFVFVWASVGGLRKCAKKWILDALGSVKNDPITLFGWYQIFSEGNEGKF